MQFTCDRCHGDYSADGTSATAYLFLRDSRCNHIEAHCSHCGHVEVIFLGARQITRMIREEGVRPTVAAEASARLRVRAEKAWAAVEEQDAVPQASPVVTNASPVPSGSSSDTTTGAVLERYELTQRHEELLDSFGCTLRNIPDALLWDELEGDHDRRHPDRWIE